MSVALFPIPSKEDQESDEVLVSKLDVRTFGPKEVTELNALVRKNHRNIKKHTLKKWQALANRNYIAIAHTRKEGIVAMGMLVEVSLVTGRVALMENVMARQNTSTKPLELCKTIERDLIREACQRGFTQADLNCRTCGNATSAVEKLGADYEVSNTVTYRVKALGRSHA